MNFSANLKQLREEKGMTQQDLANVLQVSRSTVAGYETKNKQPDYEKLLKLSHYFGVSIEYLLIGSEEEPELPPTRIELERNRSSERLAMLEEFDKLSRPTQKKAVEIVHLLRLGEKYTD